MSGDASEPEDTTRTAIRFFESGNYADATRLLKEAVAHNFRDGSVYYYGAMSATYGGDFKSAAEFGFGALLNGFGDSFALASLSAVLWRLGHHDIARGAAEAALKLNNEDIGARFSIARTSISLGDPERAMSATGLYGEHVGALLADSFDMPTRHLSVIALRCPEWAYGRYQLGVAFFRGHDYGQAAEHFRACYEIASQADEDRLAQLSGEYTCNCYMLIGAMGALSDFCVKAKERHSQTRWVRAYSGSLLIHRDRVEEGLRELETARSIEAQALPDLYGLISLIPMPAGVDANRGPIARRSHVEWHGNVRPQLPTIFCACDGKYFDQLSNLYIGSLNHHGEANCYIHIMDPLPSNSEKVDHLRQKYRNINLCVSYADLRDKGASAKAFYACERFRIARDLLDTLQCPIIVTDIDISIECNLRSYLDALPRADVGLMCESRPLPWFKNPATTFYVANTEGARDFLDAVNAYLDNAFACLGSENIWFVDQNALFMANWLRRNACSITNLSDMSPGLFGCYSGEGREAYTEARSRHYGLL